MSRTDPGLQIPLKEEVVNTATYGSFCDAQRELLQIFESQSNKVYTESFERLVKELKTKVIALLSCFLTLFYQTTGYQDRLNAKLYKKQGNFNALYELYLGQQRSLGRFDGV